jgi:tRNA 5-methylaminomethyl-2-thiouridine biosynthesis bifunctional protein
VLVCCAHAAKKLAPFVHFPLTPVRGQITIVPETASSKALQAVVCGDGYCAPAVEGVHVTGATHAFEDESTEVRATDHAENLKNLAAYAPALHQALTQIIHRNVGRASARLVGINPDLQSELTGRASIRCSAPGSMPLVGKVQQGLYCSLAHGTRGLLSAGLAGEVLAAQVCGQLPPLPAFILDALAPLPRIRNKG